MEQPSPLLTLPEVAKALRVDEESVRRWIKSGRLEGARVGNLFRISRRALEAFVGEQTMADLGEHFTLGAKR